MSNQKFAVVFTENNARVIYDSTLIEEMKDWDNVLVNPNFSDVYGLPPHLWKIRESDRHIVPLDSHEKVHRVKHIERYGTLNIARDPDKWKWGGESGMPAKEHWILKAPKTQEAVTEQPSKKPSNANKYALFIGVPTIILTLLILLLKDHF